MLLRPWSGNERRGPRCAHARVPRDPESHPLPLPEGGAHASGRGAEREERGWVAVGSRAPPVHRPCPPRAVPPALPRLCRSRVRGLAVRVACVCRSCGVPCGVASLPLAPRQRSHDRGAAVTRPSSGPGIRFWRCGLVTSLSGAAFGETAVGRLRRVAGRVGARRRPEGPSAAAGASVSAVGLCEQGKRKAHGAFRGTREGKRLSWTSVVRVVDGGSVGRGASGDSSGPVVLREGGVRVSRVGNRHPHRVGCLAVRYPPARACRSPPVWRRGLRSMTLPVPEVRPSRASWSAGAPPLTSLEGKTVRVVVASLSSSPASPAAFRSTRAARLFRGIPVPSASASRPGAAAVRFSRRARWRGRRPPPRRFPVSPDPARRVRDHPVLPGVAPRCRACVLGGPAAAPHPPSSPRPRPSAWNLGVASRRGVSRGSASRLGGGSAVPGGWPLPVPATRRPPPAPRPARPSASRRRALSPRGGVSVCVCRDLRGIPVGSHGRPPLPAGFLSRLVSLPARPGVSLIIIIIPTLRSLARFVLGFARRRRPAGPPVSDSPARASYLVDPASSICLSQRLSHACLSTHGRYSETANGSLNQLWFLWSLAPLLLG